MVRQIFFLRLLFGALFDAYCFDNTSKTLNELFFLNQVHHNLCVCVGNWISKVYFVFLVWKLKSETQSVVISLFLFLLQWFFCWLDSLYFFFLFTFIIRITFIIQIFSYFSCNIVSEVSYMFSFRFPFLFAFKLPFISNLTHYHYLHSSRI